jgi:secondary thiamine-phosphate synthase enzyme
METLSVRTTQRVEMVDITESVQKALGKSGISEGLCLVYVPHTTAGVTVNEGADPMVCRDILVHLSRTAPQAGDYRHSEGNSDSHIKVALVGPSQTLIAQGGKLRLGTWQRIFLCEFDGPRTRSVWVQTTGAGP